MPSHGQSVTMRMPTVHSQFRTGSLLVIEYQTKMKTRSPFPCESLGAAGVRVDHVRLYVNVVSTFRQSIVRVGDFAWKMTKNEEES